MTYGYIVKRDGVYYPAGTEVPEKSGASRSQADPVKPEKKYTANELGLMTVKEIRKIAAERNMTISKIIKEDVIKEFIAKQG